jgi:hypothetical protein
MAFKATSQTLPQLLALRDASRRGEFEQKVAKITKVRWPCEGSRLEGCGGVPSVANKQTGPAVYTVPL